jgi:riboflavin biosynthesis pyrimidine reductase
VNLYRVLPPPNQVIAFWSPDDRAVVLEQLTPPRLPWVRAIMVTNSAGDFQGSTGTSAGLTRGADRLLLGLYRQSADVVLTGASTTKAEPVPVPKSTPLCVVTASGDLSGHQIIQGPDRRLFIVTTEEGSARATETTGDLNPVVLTIESDGRFSAGDIIRALSPHVSTEHLLVEGGRVLWETFAAMTNELVVAVTPPPLSTHQGIPPWWPGDPSQWTLTSLMTDDEKMLYFRYETEINGVASAKPDQPA